MLLKNVIQIDPSSKIAYRKLGEAQKSLDNLTEAAKAYEELFKIDSRDARVALEISEVFLLDNQFGKALRWADKAISVNNKLEIHLLKSKSILLWLGLFQSKSIYY